MFKNKRTILSMSLLLILPFSIVAQEYGISYHKKKNVLDSFLYILKDTSGYFRELAKMPDSALMEGELFIAAGIYLRRKDYNKFRYFCKLDMEHGQLAESIIWKNGFLLSKQNKDSLFSWEYNSKEKYFSTVPRDLFDEIYNMNCIDAKIRDYNLAGLIDWRPVRVNDSLNFINLKKLIAKYGMITERKHGMIFNKFFYIILHCCHDTRMPQNFEYMRKELYTEVMKGNIRPDAYEYFVDRWGMLTSGEQTYGALLDTGKISDPDNVDKRRRLLGDCTLREWYIIKKAKQKF